MRPRAQQLFLALILAQAAHSIEEYRFRLYDALPSARFISGILSNDPARGFAIANIALVSFGLWCYLARVRQSHPSSKSWAWFWTVLEAGNGLGHLILAANRRGYFPGAATAPFLLGFSASLGLILSRAHDRA